MVAMEGLVYICSKKSKVSDGPESDMPRNVLMSLVGE
jgi:hypothetical protein